MADTTSTREASLLRVYTREKLFEPCERSEPRFWNQMKEFKDLRPGGTGRRWKITLHTGHPAGNPAEGGDWSTDRPPTEVECVVTSGQIDSPLELTSKFMEAGEGDGSYYGDPEAEGIIRATQELYAYADTLMGCGHGTGRLAIVGASSGPSTTVTLDDPEFGFQLREGMPIDFVDLDSGGTVQDSTVIVTIADDFQSIVVEDAVTVTSGWGIYKANVYGNAMPNGLRNIVDDGDFAATIFGQARAGQTGLNATVIDGGGGLQDYAEELINKGLDRVTWRQKLIPTQLRCNQGILSEYKRDTVRDRVRVGNSDNMQTGVKDSKPAFDYADGNIPFIVDRNLPSRELYGLHLPSFRKHTLRKADWCRIGGQILHPKPAAGGETYAHAYVANMLMDVTISSKILNCHVKWSNVRDRNAAGDS